MDGLNATMDYYLTNETLCDIIFEKLDYNAVECLLKRISKRKEIEEE